MKKMVNGELVDMTAEEIADIENIRAEEKTLQETEQANYDAKQNLKASAKAKLMAGEPMTEEEANLTLHI